MASSSAHGRYPADHGDSGEESHYNYESLSDQRNLQRSAWQPHVQVGRDINALALPHIEAPWDTRPPLYPPAPRSRNQRQQPVSSSYYGSSSPLRDFVPPQASLPEPHSRLETAPSLTVAQRRIGPEALAGELAAEVEVVRRTVAAPGDDGFSDIDFDSGESDLSSEDEDAGFIAAVPEGQYRDSTIAGSFGRISATSTMNPPPARISPSSSQLPSQHRTRRRSSAATTNLLNTSTAGTSQSASKRRRTSATTTGAHHLRQPTPTFSTAKSIEQIDLSLDSDPDDVALSSTLGKQRFDAIASQSASSAVKPTASPNSRGQTKLNTLQCTVCLDTPKDLTATSCGHTFCYGCLMDWLVAAERDGGGQGRRSNCPACRKPISRVRKGDVIPLEIKLMRRARRR